MTPEEMARAKADLMRGASAHLLAHEGNGAVVVTAGPEDASNGTAVVARYVNMPAETLATVAAGLLMVAVETYKSCPCGLDHSEAIALCVAAARVLTDRPTQRVLN